MYKRNKKKNMSVSKSETLPVDVLFEIFGNLSPVDVLQSFLPLNTYFSRIILYHQITLLPRSIKQKLK
jgi:hypothetical protein